MTWLRPSVNVSLLIVIVLWSPVASVAVTSRTGPPQVPFLNEGRRVIIPTIVNESRPLRLILDTGMHFDGVYLFHKELADVIDTAGAIEVQAPGAGGGAPSTAIMIENGRVRFGDVTVDSQLVLICLSQHTQHFATDGVMGWNLFGHYIVEINYDESVIFLHDSTYVPQDSGWHVIPIELKKDIPWLEATVAVNDSEKIPMQLYIDLASDEALELLVGPDQKYSLPDSLEESYLGTGLSGDIHGHYGKCRQLSIGRFDLSQVPTAFAPAEIRSRQEDADGILGNNAVRRFNVIFDYSHRRLYLKPNAIFDRPFD